MYSATVEMTSRMVEEEESQEVSTCSPVKTDQIKITKLLYDLPGNTEIFFYNEILQ